MHRANWPTKMAVFAVAVLLAGSVLLSQFVRKQQNMHIHALVDTFADEFSARLEAKLVTRAAIVELLRQEWNDGLISSVADFGRAAESAYSLFPDIQAINWVDHTGIITQVTPLEGNEVVLGLDVMAVEEPAAALELSTISDSLQLTPPLVLVQGGSGFVGYVPIFKDGRLFGHIDLVFRTDILMGSIVGDLIGETYGIVVRDGDRLLYGIWEQGSGTRFAAEREIEVGGRSWVMTITPREELLAGSRLFIDDAILFAGFILAIIVGGTVNEWDHNKRKLRDQEDRFALAIEGTSDGLYDINVETLETYYSPRWYQMLGLKADELPPNYDVFFELLHPKDNDKIPRLEDLVGLDDDMIEREFRLRHKDGSWVDILSRARFVKQDGKITRIVGTHVDLTELRSEQRKLRRATVTDDLTGLRNRRDLDDLLLREQQASKVGERVCLMRIDLDRFKAINDRDGHDAGDTMLCVVADRLRQNTYGFQVIARMGGDEFLIGWRTPARDSEILQAAGAIIATIEGPVIYANKELRVGASVGIAFIEVAEKTAVGEAIVNADIALKIAKTTGRGTQVFFEQFMRTEALENAALALEIRKGIERNEFEPYFQPQIDNKTSQIIGFEALLRWNHPQLGVLAANKFVPAAEDACLIEELDDQMFEAICRATMALDELGLPDATMSVNMSTARLMDSKLVDRLLKTVAKISVDPTRICIELLESTLLNDRMETAVSNIYSLAHAGFKIELDDFGTGHAAISSLRNFPVSRIKIDKAFVSGIHNDASLPIITETLIDLGKNLGITVLIEGVENAAERNYFQNSKCDQIQGFFVGRPMPQNDLSGWIAEWTTTHVSKSIAGE